MKVKVTQQHLEQGHRFDCKRCPIALALHDAFPQFSFQVASNSVEICVRDGNVQCIQQTRKQIPLTNDLQQFIINFDLRRIYHPFAFDFEI